MKRDKVFCCQLVIAEALFAESKDGGIMTLLIPLAVWAHGVYQTSGNYCFKQCCMDWSLSGNHTYNVMVLVRIQNILFSCLLPALLRIEPRALCMLGKRSTSTATYWITFSGSLRKNPVFYWGVWVFSLFWGQYLFFLIASTEGWCYHENIFLLFIVSVCHGKGYDRTAHVTVRQETETGRQKAQDKIWLQGHIPGDLFPQVRPHILKFLVPSWTTSSAGNHCMHLNGWDSWHPNLEENMTAP